MNPFILHIDKHNNFNKIFIPLAIKFLEILKKNNASVAKNDSNKKYARKIIFGSHTNPEYWKLTSSEEDIIVNLESLYKKEFREKNKSYIDLLKSRTTFDYCSLNSEFLNNHFYFKVPPHFVYSQKDSFNSIEKKYDILFVGSRNKKRLDFLKKISETKLKLVTGFKIFSKNLDLAIKQSKIYLHLDYDENTVFNNFKFAQCSKYETIYAGHSGNIIDNPHMKEMLNLSLFKQDDEMLSGIKNLISNQKDYLKALNEQKKISSIYEDEFNSFIKSFLKLS